MDFNDRRRYLRAAEKAGARIEMGKKHVKVFDGQELVAVLSHGQRFSGPGDGAMIRKLWREKGWL